jgi:hypothetical protein
MYRALDASKLLDTSEKMRQRLETRFPGAGLGEVAREVSATTRDAAMRAEKIAAPNIPLRVGLLGLFGLLILGVILSLTFEMGQSIVKVWNALEGMRGAAFTLALILFFFWTLETRFKRRKALKALHELRSLTHVIDMHQLAKDPEQVSEGGTVEIGGHTMDAAAMAAYLQFCTELLSLVSKIGHLYVQDFPDATSLTAADQVETLATGLSQKIWQKIIILDRIRSDGAKA